jgi:hypothetical protein
MYPPTAGERLRRGAIGLLLLVPTFVGSAVGFYLVLLGCHAENVTHFSRACPPSDAYETGLAFVGVVGLAGSLPLLGLLGMRPRGLIAVGAAICGFWLLYVVATFPT